MKASLEAPPHRKSSIPQVDTAVRFLNNPKLQGASLSSRREFLKKKGV